MRKSFRFAAGCGSVAIMLMLAASSQATLSYTTAGSTHTETFDTLANTGSITWTNDSTLPNWSLFRQPAPGTAIAAVATGTGSSNAGTFISFGSAASTDRALGGVASGGAYFGSPASTAVAGWIAFSATNNTGSVLTDITVGYDGEQWRDGGSAGGTPAAQTMGLEYGFGTSFTTVPTWTAAGAAFNFTSPVFTNITTGAAVDGNVAGKTTGRGGTVSSLSWATGSTLWIRFIENNDAGNDHGLSVDNFTFSAAAVPEASAFLFGGLACCVGAVKLVSRKLRARKSA